MVPLLLRWSKYYFVFFIYYTVFLRYIWRTNHANDKYMIRTIDCGLVKTIVCLSFTLLRLLIKQCSRQQTRKQRHNVLKWIPCCRCQRPTAMNSVAKVSPPVSPTYSTTYSPLADSRREEDNKKNDNRLTANAKRQKFFRRLLKFRQMDFEYAFWQMIYLFVSPQKV